MSEERTRFENLGKCHNCHKTKLGGKVNLNTEKGVEIIFVCDECYVDWYLK